MGATRRTNLLLRVLLIVLAPVALATPQSATAETDCGSDGYRVISRRWDPVLKLGWESKQSCAHPDWPLRSVLAGREAMGESMRQGSIPSQTARVEQAFLVHAGDTVRLWQQSEKVRIEMYGVVEQSARNAQRVIVRIVRQTGDEGITTEQISGIVRAAGDVEMEW
jgi:hypothetical protein